MAWWIWAIIILVVFSFSKVAWDEAAERRRLREIEERYKNYEPEPGGGPSTDGDVDGDSGGSDGPDY
ncbi:hypothetical protein AB0O22_32060 [Streptomyces sp. NPDC091204]|uniref:hypothetical protein n=1 Tax=Streptomyces sp. NPDC091204 TaxID=3155299 RepID=UPI003416D79F